MITSILKEVWQNRINVSTQQQVDRWNKDGGVA